MTTGLGDPRPRPLRVLAAASGVITLIIGGLPTVGVPLTADQTGWLVALVGAVGAVGVALLGEQAVTPVSSPRDQDGTPLAPDRSPRQDLP